jgi:AcrR family transcriptional regulator
VPTSSLEAAVAAQAAAQLDPRVVRTRTVVIAATCDMLVNDGHSAITIDGLAKRTGVARTTIYRHWATIEDLLDDAMRSMAAPKVVPDTGSVSDVCEHLANLARALREDPWGQVLPTLIDAGFRSEAMAEHQRELVHDRRTMLHSILRRGIERGELDPADIDVARWIDDQIDRLTGPIFVRHLLLRDATDDAYIERLVAGVLPTAVGTGR